MPRSLVVGDGADPSEDRARKAQERLLRRAAASNQRPYSTDANIREASAKLSEIIGKMLADPRGWTYHWPAFFWMRRLALNILHRHIRNAPRSGMGMGPAGHNITGAVTTARPQDFDAYWKKASRLTTGLIYVWRLFRE